MLCAFGLRTCVKTQYERASRNGTGRHGYAGFTALVAMNVLMYGSSKSPPEMSS